MRHVYCDFVIFHPTLVCVDGLVSLDVLLTREGTRNVRYRHLEFSRGLRRLRAHCKKPLWPIIEDDVFCISGFTCEPRNATEVVAIAEEYKCHCMIYLGLTGETKPTTLLRSLKLRAFG